MKIVFDPPLSAAAMQRAGEEMGQALATALRDDMAAFRKACDQMANQPQVIRVPRRTGRLR
ncbi:MAG TPA: hypothetical protein VI039_12950 [Solirubrobacterales bacterium]